MVWHCIGNRENSVTICTHQKYVVCIILYFSYMCTRPTVFSWERCIADDWYQRVLCLTHISDVMNKILFSIWPTEFCNVLYNSVNAVTKNIAIKYQVWQISKVFGYHLLYVDSQKTKTKIGTCFKTINKTIFFHRFVVKS